MNISLENLNKVYSALGDNISKEIFMNRIMLAISGRDIKWERNNILMNERIKEFIARIKSISKTKEMVIFGSGLKGKELCYMINDVPWKCFIDNNPNADKVEGLPVIKYDDFLKNYHGECIVISSRIYQQQMEEQLNRDGVFDNIINFGKIMEKVMDEQYFDLEFMRSINKKEIFLDIGCYDGRTSINFKKWCKKDLFVYAFEPDIRRVEECILNLENSQIQYKLINKGVWSEETVLHFKAEEQMDSHICENGEEIIEVISLDKTLCNKEVTFIKMDIEGSELQALIGARNVIMKNRPTLMISVYHTLNDIFLIPDIILQYYPNYKFYFRHYSISASETVLYALPD